LDIHLNLLYFGRKNITLKKMILIFLTNIEFPMKISIIGNRDILFLFIIIIVENGQVDDFYFKF